MIREISYIRSEARDTTVTNDVTQRDARVRDIMSQTAKYQPMRRRAPIIMIASLCYTCNAHAHCAHPPETRHITHSKYYYKYECIIY